MATASVVVVTGAGSGIGKACAEKFLAMGWRVVAVDKQDEGLASLQGENTAQAESLEILQIDITSKTAPRDIFAACKGRFGRLDCLVNNAGIGNARSIWDTSDEDCDLYLDVNLGSMFRLCREVRTEFTAGGSIVNNASVFGLVGFQGASAYSASKAGVIGLTRQLAADYGPLGIRVNAVAPGLIVTPMTEERVRTNTWLVHAAIDTIPLGRPGKPDDVAEAMFFLGSDSARHISGVVLPVDGGWSGTRFSPNL